MANEVTIRVSADTKAAEAGVKRVQASFKELGDLSRKAGFGLSAFAAGGILLGKSLIGTALASGASSESVWRLQDASFQLRKTLGILLIDALNPVMDGLARFLRWLNETNPTLLKVVVYAALVATAVAAIGGPLLIVLGLIPAFAAGIGILTGVFGALSVAMGPITLIVLGIAAAVGVGLLLWRNWETVLEGLRGALAAFDSALGGILGRMGLLGSETENTGKQQRKWWQTLLLIADKPIQFSIELATDKVPGLMQSAWDKINAWWKDAHNPGQFSIELAPDKGPGSMQSAWDKINAWWKDKKISVPFQFGGGGDGEEGEASTLGGVFQKLLDKIFPSKDDIKERLAEGSAALNEAGNMYIALPQRIEESGKWEQFKENWFAFWDNVRIEAGKIWNRIWGSITKTWNKLRDALAEKWDTFKKKWSEFWTAVKDKACEIWEGIQETLGTIWDSLKTKVETTFGAIQTFVENTWNTVKRIVDSIMAAVDRAKAALRSVGGRISIPGRQAGGPASGLTMVGEGGPELVNLPTGSHVFSNSQSRNILASGGSGGMTVVWNQNAAIYGFEDFRREVDQVVRDSLLYGGYAGAR